MRENFPSITLGPAGSIEYRFNLGRRVHAGRISSSRVTRPSTFLYTPFVNGLRYIGGRRQTRHSQNSAPVPHVGR